ncbi:MAG: sulfite exporter TauE/SafE family protein [Flavobacteriales bacterium]
MEETLLIGCGLAIVIGLIMGLLGGGGSILTVPIFVYLLGFDEVTSTAYSLFVIGATSTVGAGRNVLRKNVDFISALAFGLPSFIAIYLTRRYLIPEIPEEIFALGTEVFNRKTLMMLFFSLLLIVAAVPMIKKRKLISLDDLDSEFSYAKMVFQGSSIGFLSGLVGAGGGFLILPALVLLSKLPMKRAVGTTLFIIAFNSLIGFSGDVQNIEIDWMFLLPFTAFSIGGILLGVYFSKFIEGPKLKRVFGIFVLAMAAYIIVKELIL